MSSYLSEKTLKKIEENLVSLRSRHADLKNRLIKLQSQLTKEGSKKYLLNGVIRRLNIIKRCVDNIYSIFPIEKKDLLNQNELHDLDINLHAFFINIFGLLDNLCWVWVYEKDLDKFINKKEVGLYKKKTQNYFDDSFREYLNSERMKKWHNGYLQSFRDTLAHRIPLYVPPKNLSNNEEREKENLLWENMKEAIWNDDNDEAERIDLEMSKNGSVAPFFLHDLEEKSKVMNLHAQIITDFGTIEEIIEKYLDMFQVNSVQPGWEESPWEDVV